MSDELRVVCEAIRAFRYTVSTEEQMQAGVAAALTAKGLTFTREQRLTARDRPDFMVGRVAVELKVKGSNKDVRAQLMRYAEHVDVDAVVLVSSRTRHGLQLPDTLCGKPLAMVNASRAFS